jgi:hypothetical protein
VKYLLLIYQNPANFQTLSEADREAVFAEVGALIDELTASGEWVTGEGLGDPSTARSVRVRDGVTTVTDGPFAEAKEQVVGFNIVDCESMERAVEIAARWPDARWWGMEVRPILSPDGVEM